LSTMRVVAVTGMDLSYIEKHIPEDLRDRLEFIWCKHSKDATEWMPNAEILVTTGRFDPSLLTNAPKLHLVQTLSAGIDKLPLAELIQLGIAVTNAKGVHTIQMSEFAISLMLQWVRKSDMLSFHQQKKIWNQQVPVGELYGKTVGILGAGAIGEAVARKSKAFDMQVIGYNRKGLVQPYFDEIVTSDEGLSYLLQTSDFVVLLLPSTPKTRHIIREAQLKLMKPSAFLINLARGDVIHEAELITALQQGIIAGAALDVFEQEPLPEFSPLWTMDNVIVTPHIAGSTDRYVERAAPILFDNIRAYLTGEPFTNLVDLKEGY
jgi:phosphoglycerate dehydrogenase-like enzyme